MTSNEVPGQPGGAGGTAGPAGTEGTGATGSGRDGVLDAALEGLDGEILAERAVIRARANETAGALPGQGAAGEPAANPAAGGGGGRPDASGTGAAGGDIARSMPGMPQNRTAPPAPMPTAGTVPDDIPVAARDDDIIARQLREAAMQEADPELREKLWEEYRRYKGI